MILAVLDPWIALAKQWQPLLAGLLAVLAAIILSAGIVRSAKIRAGGSRRDEEPASPQDLRASAPPALAETTGSEGANAHLEKLRSLLRSALSALASTDPETQTARALCSRIGAFQWAQFPLPANADKHLQETYATFLNQFEMLEVVLRKEWSPQEVSAILIQLNANIRTLSALLKALESDEPDALSQQSKN